MHVRSDLILVYAVKTVALYKREGASWEHDQTYCAIEISQTQIARKQWLMQAVLSPSQVWHLDNLLSPCLTNWAPSLRRRKGLCVEDMLRPRPMSDKISCRYAIFPTHRCGAASRHRSAIAWFMQKSRKPRLCYHHNRKPGGPGQASVRQWCEYNDSVNVEKSRGGINAARGSGTRNW